MASTNKTTHYELSQYVGTDKPTYLTDYNNDMENIDTGIYNAQTKADSAESKATIADGKAVQAQSDATTALNSAGSANTNIGTMANLTTTDKTSLVGAINENVSNIADNTSKINNFNLTHFDNYDKTNITINSGASELSNDSSITVAYNEDGSLAKIYGGIFPVGNATSGALSISFSTNLRPTSAFRITNPGIVRRGSTTEVVRIVNMLIGTDGVVSITATLASGSPFGIYLWPCLYFVKDFGDVPSPQN